MKKFLFILLLISGLNSAVHAGMTQNEFIQKGGIKKLTYTCTFGAGGAWTTTDTRSITGFLLYVATVPSGAPTANYDIVMNDVHGVDIMGGDLLNRSSTAAERTDYNPKPIVGPLEVVISNNSAAGASVLLTLYYIDMK